MGRDRSRSPHREDRHRSDRRRREDQDEREGSSNGRRRERSRERSREKERDRLYSSSSRKDKDKKSYSDSEDDEKRRARKREKKEHRKSRKDNDEDEESEKKSRKRARRAREDEAALQAAEDQRRAAAELSVYGSTDNPFNDSNLTDQFVWGKKRDKEKKAGMSQEQAQRKDIERRAEAKEELERLNRRRAEREKEMEERELEQNRLARLAETEQMAAWFAKEDEFHLEQGMRRAQIRMRENRAKPIDLLALNLKWSKPRVEGEKTQDEEEEEDDGMGLDVDLEEPYLIFDNLTLEETEELYEDITMYISLEKNESNLEFWRSMMVVCSSALETLRSERSLGRNAFMDQARSNQSIKADITRLLQGKSLNELRALQDSVRAKLSSGDPIDVEYWEGLLKELAVWMSKSKLRTMHEVVLRNRLEHLRRKQRDEAVRVQNELVDEVQARERKREEEEEARAEMLEQRDSLVQEEWDESMAPALVQKVPREDQHLQLVDPVSELVSLITSRRSVASTRFVPKKARPADEAEDPSVAAGEALVKAEKAKGLDEDEEVLNQESELRTQSYTWQDKYRPRKPRYFNKVITGFEWNKYNQTHYDIDNPPPKVVQAYRFTIFCPDLVDPAKAPTYKVIKEPGNDDTCVLHFKIGPPYEDLAFRIVNKPWEYSHKKGFQSKFERGVLQLHFSFSRMFYRK